MMNHDRYDSLDILTMNVVLILQLYQVFGPFVIHVGAVA